MDAISVSDPSPCRVVEAERRIAPGTGHPNRKLGATAPIRRDRRTAGVIEDPAHEEDRDRTGTIADVPGHGQTDHRIVNLDIPGAPPDPDSAGSIAFFNGGSVRKLHPDFGAEAFPGSVQVYGFP
jgi:hypothetical protein